MMQSNEREVQLPTNIEKRYCLIHSVFSSHHGNISATVRALKISRNTVKKACRWYEDGCPPISHAIGRPVKITANVKYLIVIYTIYFPEMSAIDVATIIERNYQITLSETSINECRKKHAFRYGPKIKSLKLSRKHRSERFQFCRKLITITPCFIRILNSPMGHGS